MTERHTHLWRDLAAMFAVLVILLIAGELAPAHSKSKARATRPAARASVAAAKSGTTATTGVSVDGPLIVTGFVAILIVAGVLGASGRRRSGWDLGDPPPDIAVSVVDASLEELRSIADPRQAVIAAYSEMLGRLRQVGLGRRPAETPFEHLRRALAAGAAGEVPLRALTTLYEEARFSRHAMDEGDRATAIDALEVVRAAVARPASTGPEKAATGGRARSSGGPAGVGAAGVAS